MCQWRTIPLIADFMIRALSSPLTQKKMVLLIIASFATKAEVSSAATSSVSACFMIHVWALLENVFPDSWECSRCIIDEMVQDGDIKIVSKVFRHWDGRVCNEDDFSGKVLMLNKVHEMLVYLMNFGFGYEFKVPVDCTTCPGYLDVV